MLPASIRADGMKASRARRLSHARVRPPGCCSVIANTVSAARAASAHSPLGVQIIDRLGNRTSGESGENFTKLPQINQIRGSNEHINDPYRFIKGTAKKKALADWIGSIRGRHRSSAPAREVASRLTATLERLARQ